MQPWRRRSGTRRRLAAPARTQVEVQRRVGMAHSVGSDLLAVHAAGQALQGGCRRITCPPSHLPTVPSSPLTSISFPVISPPTHSSAAKAPLPPAAGAAGERGRRCRDAGTWSPRQLRCTPPAAQLPAACLRRNPPQARACDLLHALHHILLAAVDHLICRNRGGGARADGSGQVQWPCADDRGGGGGGGRRRWRGGRTSLLTRLRKGSRGMQYKTRCSGSAEGGLQRRQRRAVETATSIPPHLPPASSAPPCGGRSALR